MMRDRECGQMQMALFLSYLDRRRRAKKVQILKEATGVWRNMLFRIHSPPALLLLLLLNISRQRGQFTTSSPVPPVPIERIIVFSKVWTRFRSYRGLERRQFYMTKES